MNTIVVYNSKTGFSEKYGKWIGEELNCQAVPLKNSDKLVQDADLVIYGGGIMAGRVAGLDKFKTNPALSGKKLLIYGTGATSKDTAHVIEQMEKDNLKGLESSGSQFFYFEGGINYERMSFPAKTLLKFLVKTLKNKKDRTPDETGMMEALEKPFDHSDKEAIKPLILAAKQ